MKLIMAIRVLCRRFMTAADCGCHSFTLLLMLETNNHRAKHLTWLQFALNGAFTHRFESAKSHHHHRASEHIISLVANNFDTGINCTVRMTALNLTCFEVAHQTWIVSRTIVYFQLYNDLLFYFAPFEVKREYACVMMMPPTQATGN